MGRGFTSMCVEARVAIEMSLSVACFTEAAAVCGAEKRQLTT